MPGSLFYSTYPSERDATQFSLAHSERPWFYIVQVPWKAEYNFLIILFWTLQYHLNLYFLSLPLNWAILSHYKPNLKFHFPTAGKSTTASFDQWRHQFPHTSTAASKTCKPVYIASCIPYREALWCSKTCSLYVEPRFLWELIDDGMMLSIYANSSDLISY